MRIIDGLSSNGLVTLSVFTVAALVLAACAINPATGQNQLSFFGEAEEIQLGLEVDQEFLANSGEYSDEALGAYVAELGHRMAAISERPDLPWKFRIADDDIVNAFALPGGVIYVTRGLLAHLNREAELVGVLGHEIGHVTARHSVNGMSRNLAISFGVMAGLALLDVDDASQAAAGLGLQMLFLKFGRNQERQADQLGVRYAQRAGFDPHGVVDVLRVLQSVSQAQGDGWIPTWLSTHPDPDKRWQRLADETSLGPGRSASELEPEVREFLPRLHGLVYGPDPRDGMLRQNNFVQLKDGYQMSFPSGWKIEREGRTVAAESDAEDALVMLLPNLAGSEIEAAEAFAEDTDIDVVDSWQEPLGGLPARVLSFDAELDDVVARGLAAFVRTNGRIVTVIGLSSIDSWASRRRMIERSIFSMSRVRSPERYQARPEQVVIVALEQAMTLRQAATHYSPGVEAETFALLNQMRLDHHLEAGRWIKTIWPGR